MRFRMLQIIIVRELNTDDFAHWMVWLHMYERAMRMKVFQRVFELEVAEEKVQLAIVFVTLQM